MSRYCRCALTVSYTHLEKENMHDTLEKKAFDPLGGDKWFPKETWFEEDMPEYWGDWGCHSEVDELKAVLMRRPGAEVDDFNFREVIFRTEIDPAPVSYTHLIILNLCIGKPPR